MITPEGYVGAAAAEKLGTFRGSTDGSRGTTAGAHQAQCVEEGLAPNADVERQGPPVAAVAAGDTVKTGHPDGLAVYAGGDETRGRAVQALPLVRRRGRRSAAGRPEGNAGEGVWFDRTILRVGARVPWGRQHRGRFAKVSFPTECMRRSRVHMRVDGRESHLGKLSSIGLPGLDAGGISMGASKGSCWR